MLTINETSVNKKSNMKLILSIMGSTATIGVGAVYLLSNANNTSSSNGSKFLNMIPETFSGKMKMQMHDNNGFYGYSSAGVFNKFNDENNEWTLEASIVGTDLRNNQVHGHYLKNDRMYVADNETIDCEPNYRKLGYAQLKYAIANGVEVNTKQLESEVLKRSEQICTDDATKMVVNSGDYGTLLICGKQTKHGISGGVYGQQFDVVFESTENVHEIKLPLSKSKGFYFNEKLEGGCRKNDKFETVKEFDAKKLEKVNRVSYEFNTDTFPFDTTRELGRAPRIISSNMGNTGKDGKTIKQPPAPVETEIRCVWVHGAGNHKATQKTGNYDKGPKLKHKKAYDGKNFSYKSFLYKTEDWPGMTMSNETVFLTPETPDSEVSKNTTEKYWATTRFLFYNGSTRFYSYEQLHSQHPDARDTFYPFFIRGANSFNGITDARGILHDVCQYGKFWFTNSASEGRLYNAQIVANELVVFNCGEGVSSCTLGEESDSMETVYFTHSYGGMITMQGFHKGNFTKGPKWVWGASQSPFRGSPGGNAGEYTCSGTYNRFSLIKKLVFKGLWHALRFMNYCKNDMTGSRYTHGLMVGMYEYEGSESWGTDYLIDYKYCGNHPGGLIHHLYSDNYGSNRFDVGIGANVGNNIAKRHGNDFSLLMLDYWSCRFFSFCGEMNCNITNQLCTWRGCIMSYCAVDDKNNWKNERFDYMGDGMVMLASCIADEQTDYFLAHADIYVQDITGITPIYQFNPSDLHYYEHEDLHPMGASYVTIQNANHEDGTGTNGNGMSVYRAPVNWYTNVARAVLRKQLGVWDNMSDLHSWINYWDQNDPNNDTVWWNFWAGESNVLVQENRDIWNEIDANENYAVTDFDASGGNWN